MQNRNRSVSRISSGCGDREVMRIELSDISKRFEQKQVLSQVSMTLEEGGIYLLMGTSGIGKTTLLRILLGLEQPDSGTVRAPARISAVFQENRLLGYADAVKNIRIAAGRSGLLYQPEEVLSGLLEQESWYQPVETLSGGMQRRAAIARALAVSSELLVMDEPFAGLDEETRRQTIRRILELRGGRTLLAVSHQREDAGLLGAKLLQIEGGVCREMETDPDV